VGLNGKSARRQVLERLKCCYDFGSFYTFYQQASPFPASATGTAVGRRTRLFASIQREIGEMKSSPSLIDCKPAVQGLGRRLRAGRPAVVPWHFGRSRRHRVSAS
jgi:hypothetical protein